MTKSYWKYKAIWTKIEDLKNIELNALQVYDDRSIKTKIRTYRDKVYTNFSGLNAPEDHIEWEPLQSFILTFCLYTKTNITFKFI